MTLSSETLLIYVLVFFRMAGLLAFNPILTQKSIPAQLRIALMLALTFFTAPGASEGYTLPATDAGFLWAAFCEMTLGLAIGFVIQCFYYLLFTVGDVADQGFGLAMAKAFNPDTNIQTSMTARILQFLFVGYFFATNGHLIFLQIASSSYQFVGIGATTIFDNAPAFLISLFIQVFSLCMQLLAPFLVATITLEVGMGILMKLVPQMNIFVLHFQLKVMLGLFLVFLYATPISNFIMNYETMMFQQMQKLLEAM